MPTSLLKWGSAISVCLFVFFGVSRAQTVSQVKATYRNGQVFLTWNNLAADNKRYKIYRSIEKIGSTAKLNNSTVLGIVTDNSSKNVRKSQLKGTDHYYKIDPAGSPLSPSTGLFVITCTDNKKWYYAVTTVDMVTGIENKTLALGSNSLNLSVVEHKESPQPVLQQTVDLGNGSTAFEYVIWGNKQEVSTMPAFNNVGSFGYNFTFIRHNETADDLYLLFRDSDPFGNASPDNCDDCNVLLIDDWLPNGSKTYWFGYNENYDIYSSFNEVQSTGTIKGYTQARIKYILNWVTSNLQSDATKVYAGGSSHNGFGAMLTANLIPEKIAAEWLTVAPPIIKAINGSDYEKLWCDNALSLVTDVLNPQTGAAMTVWDVFDLRGMYELNKNRGLPYIGAVHGKQDNTVGWVQQLHWYDSLEYSRQGGVWYWDQRQHNGSGKQFLDDEIKFDLKRFSTAKSYPAFSYCSINQNPGNGSKTSGDPYGAINGYLDWVDSTVTDVKCDYSITCFIRDMYVNGVLQQQYDSCTTDVTLRRLQKFKPNIGASINWSVLRDNGSVAASGSFIHDGGPITLYSIPVYRSGATIDLHVSGCNRMEGDEPVEAADFTFMWRENGYLIRGVVAQDIPIHITLFDLAGRTVMEQTVNWHEGVNEISMEANLQGEFIMQLLSDQFAINRKLFF